MTMMNNATIPFCSSSSARMRVCFDDASSAFSITFLPSIDILNVRISTCCHAFLYFHSNSSSLCILQVTDMMVVAGLATSPSCRALTALRSKSQTYADSFLFLPSNSTSKKLRVHCCVCPQSHQDDGTGSACNITSCLASTTLMSESQPVVIFLSFHSNSSAQEFRVHCSVSS